MSRTVKFVADLGEFKAGETMVVEDQIAVDAIAQGYAVPSIEAVEAKVKAIRKAPEVVAADGAPEIK